MVPITLSPNNTKTIERMTCMSLFPATNQGRPYAAPTLSKQSKEVTIGLASARPHYVWTSMASQAGVFRGARLSSLPTNAVCGEG